MALLGSGLSPTVTTPSGAPDAGAEAWIAHESALTFETLLSECQPLYPGIVLRR